MGKSLTSPPSIDSSARRQIPSYSFDGCDQDVFKSLLFLGKCQIGRRCSHPSPSLIVLAMTETLGSFWGKKDRMLESVLKIEGSRFEKGLFCQKIGLFLRAHCAWQKTTRTHTTCFPPFLLPSRESQPLFAREG